MTLYNEDCLTAMDNIPDKSVDLVLCDPPYGTTACKWDSVIPFDKMWIQLERIVKDNGAILLFGSEPFSSLLRISNIKLYKYDWIWDKKSGMGFLDSKFRPLKSHEIISVFSIGGCSNGSKIPMKYNPQGVIYKEKKISGIRKTKIIHSKTIHKCFTSSGSNFPKSILQFPRVSKAVHPCQKPVELLMYLINTYSNENDIVLDFCMGSGSTGVAAKKTNRNFIGIELDKKYFDIAENRIKEA